MAKYDSGPEPAKTADVLMGKKSDELSSSRDVDVAAQFLSGLDQSILNEPITPKEARSVLWKIDLSILPLMWITTTLAAVDKVVISNAAIYGMKTDTHLTGDEYSWVGSIFYFGYLLAEWPISLCVQRYPVAKVFAGTVLMWGVLMMCTAATQNFAGLATVRFIMGMTEASVFPVCSIFTVMWYKTREQPVRAACWYSQFSSVFTGVISYGIGHIVNSKIATWRLLFLVLGGFSLLWGVALWIFLPDSPTTCWYMSEREKYICFQRVQGNNTGVEDKKIKWYQVRECLVDPKTWLIFIFAISQNIPNGGLVTFAAIIVSGLGYSTLVTVILGIPTGIIATCWTWSLAWPAGRFKNIRCLLIAGANLITLTCAILMWKLDSANKHGLLAAYYVFYTYWAPYVIATTLPMANTSGHSKKITMNALIFIAYCVGNIIGPQTFRSTDAPSYSHGYMGLLACLVVSIVAILGYAAVAIWQNKKRDEAEAEAGAVSGPESDAGAFSDLTDGQKPGFRYIY